MATTGLDRHGRELFWNHLWESLNAAAKTLLFAVLTPLMLAAWGTDRFGLFAVANSCIGLMVFFDGGLRTLTRVGLSDRKLSEPAKFALHARNVGAFVLAAAVGLTIIFTLAATGHWSTWLHLPAGGDLLIAVASLLAAITWLLQLLLERIAATEQQLSKIKATLFAGNVLGFLCLGSCLRLGVGVVPATFAYFAALALPLLFLLPSAQVFSRPFLVALVRLRPRELLAAFQPGAWINVITGSWLLQSYGLVFLIAWVSSPAEAGKFFLFLKLSEFLSVLGASASEPTVAALAGSRSLEEKRQRLATGYRSAVALCLAGAAGYAFFCGDLFRVWLGLSVHPSLGLLIGLAGAATAFGRMITAACLGLNRPRPAALGALVGALLMVAAVIFGYRAGGAALVLGFAVLAGLFFAPAGLVVSRDLGTTFSRLWLEPILRFAPSLGVIILVCALAARWHHPLATLAAVGVSGLIAVRHLFPRPAPVYDTRSQSSAFVMRALDQFSPSRPTRSFAWSGPLVISSVAGLGDLFIHLPLIAGIVAEARRRQLPVRVAMRPAHLAIGRACGWDVIPFDNALEDFFKNPASLRPFALWRRVRALRAQRAACWIDLTGNAISALAIKLAGARRIAARTTRGGRKLIDHPLPHEIGENEYANVDRVAAYLGCRPDYGIFSRLADEPVPGLEETVVLCLTTICRWRNWPLQNFLALVDRFFETPFVVTGLRREVAPEELAVLETILARPNVTSRLDGLALSDLIRLIAHARAVITNDTSTAHLANGFGIPGAILFGPASPDKFGANLSMRNFVDRSCPLHPCVQWSCGNQANWCMRKISAREVGDHLAQVLANSYAAAVKVA
ncbi:MAG: glycosyltransferase family 9 protein [Chthoniobacterales bacterium]